MFSRQVLRSVRAAAPQRALALRTTPVRSFAAAAAEVQPPVAVFGVDGTYATALVRHSNPRPRREIRVPLRVYMVHFRSPMLAGQVQLVDGAVHKHTREITRLTFLRQLPQYTAAAKSSTLDPTAKALSTLGALIQKDPKLGEILSAPTLSNADKSAIVAELTKQSGAQGATVKNFLDTLAENNRLGLLGSICEKFNTIVSAARGEVEMKVTSAQVGLLSRRHDDKE